MNISNLMRTNLNVAGPEAGFEALLCKHSELGHSRMTYIVDEDNHLLGIISANVLLRALIPEQLSQKDKDDLLRRSDLGIFRRVIEANRSKCAADLMNTLFSHLRPDDSFLKANLLLMDKPVNAIPVLDEGGRLLGEVTRRIILSYLVRNVCACPMPD